MNHNTKSQIANLKVDFNHLKKGETPIRASLYCSEILAELLDICSEDQLYGSVYQTPKAMNVNYVNRLKELSDLWIDYEKEWAWVISELNSKDKYSNHYLDCTSLLISWKSKTSGEILSTLTHSDPLWVKQPSFEETLVKRINELKQLSIEWSIDSIISWWSGFSKSYIESVSLLSNIIESNLWFQPHIINQPKTIKDSTNSIYLRTQEKRLFFFRDIEDGEFIPHTLKDIYIPYTLKDIEIVRELWQKKYI